MKDKNLKLRTKSGKWFVTDRGVEKEFNDSRHAWDFIFTMLKVRPAQPHTRKEMHPVLSLVPPMQKVQMIRKEIEA